MFESRRHRALLGLRIVAQFGFGGRDVPNGLQQPAMVEPVDPFERRELDRL